MIFEEVLNESVAMVQRQGRVSYRTVQRQFDLDDVYMADLKEALLYTHAEVVNDDGRGLVWIGEPLTSLPNTQPDTDRETRLQAMLPIVIALLRSEGRVTHRTLKYAFGVDDALLVALRKELFLRKLANSEEGDVLVWASESRPELDASEALPFTSLAMAAPASLVTPMANPANEQNGEP